MKVAVVGRGLIGSAAARHLAKAGHAVTLIGPGEPADWQSHTGVFASHYDEGRITRINDRRPFFARVSAASIGRYPEIARESGMSFFTASGSIVAGGTTFMADVERARDGLDVTFDALDPEALKVRFPFLSLPPDQHAAFEANAGHISPRNLVAAQTEAARRAGATLIAEEASGVTDHSVTTASGTHDADRVIVAAGGWTDTLLGRAPVLDVYARTVAFFEIEGDEARRLATMPTVVHESSDDLYILPPIRYPDGKLWLKLGGDPEDVRLPDRAAVTAWYQSGGSADIADYLTDRIRQIVPGLAFATRHHKPCVTTWTKDRLPEIRRLSPGLIVAAGGNGSGAKCSDELGRMAAALATEMEEEEHA